MPALKSPPAHKNTGIEARCAATGMRMTEQRRVIARVLSQAADHPDAEELHRRAAAVDANISLATVYRTVKLFEDSGIIERHDFRDGRSRYEAAPESHHDHLINLRDGTVIEFTSEVQQIDEATHQAQVWPRDKPVAASSGSDQSRAPVSNQAVPAASDISPTWSPVSQRRR